MEGGTGAGPLLLGTWSSSEWTLSCHDRDQVPSFPLARVIGHRLSHVDG